MTEEYIKRVRNGDRDAFRFIISDWKDAARRSIRSSVFISWFFFIVGALSGLAAAMIIPMFDVLLFGLELRHVAVIVQIVLFIAIATQFDSLLSHTRRLQVWHELSLCPPWSFRFSPYR